MTNGQSACRCDRPHDSTRRVVVTGGPGAGKTAVLELARRVLCEHADILPEAATIVFGGGFPREKTPEARRAAQRAIARIQRELEEISERAHRAAVTLCDRGTLDGLAYWPGDTAGFWTALGSTREDELLRYDAVIHLRVPSRADGFGHSNPLRVETAEEAAAIDERIFEAWQGHPRRFVIGSTADFMEKLVPALSLIQAEMPPCCRHAPEAAVVTRPV